jgi:hypothetical protein
VGDPWSTAVNKAAMTAPELAQAVPRYGRHSVGDLYGLVFQDSQIRVLLGEPPSRIGPTPTGRPRRPAVLAVVRHVS